MSNQVAKLKKRPYTLSSTAKDFINDAYLSSLLNAHNTSIQRVRELLAKSLALTPLTVKETAELCNAEAPEAIEEIFEAARNLKQKVYGRRIVIFAPLYIGNFCVNDCLYCSFRRSNKDIERMTLSKSEIVEQVAALENKGHKRLVLAFGESPSYTAEFISDCVKTVYDVKTGHGEIRRVNINAAPFDNEGFKIIKDAGIGTYQIFMETYNHNIFNAAHPKNTQKNDYLWRLDSLSRAMEAGCDDVGLGVLFGLSNWKFDVLGLISHSRFLYDNYGVGPHTISFPRMKLAFGTNMISKHTVNDEQFKRIVAILRLAVPYTGLILTAREDADIRREVIAMGVSQIDAGSRIELGGYTMKEEQKYEKGQFMLGDLRSLDEVIYELIEHNYMPSFCTACYRLGRTGEHFMEYAIPGFINDLCAPNALITLKEFLNDYASEKTRTLGERFLKSELNKIQNKTLQDKIEKRLSRIENSEERDFYF